MTSMKLKPSTLLFSGISLFIASLGFSQTAAATTQLTENVMLDTDLKFQGSNLHNGDLGQNGSDNAATAAAEARFKLTVNFNPNTLLFWEGRGVASGGRGGFETVDTGAISDGDNFLEWRQSYLQFSNLGSAPADIKVGRQKVRDDYGVWWNQNFDALRYTYNTTLFQGSIAGGQNMFSYRTGDHDFLENDKELARFLAEGKWQYYYDHFFEARVMAENDHSDIAIGDLEDPNDVDDREGHAYWGGVRAAGNTTALIKGAGKMAYRIDLMAVRGSEDVATTVPAGNQVMINAINDQDVRGWAFDASTDIPLPNMPPIIHLGYAFGTGDDNAADGTDHGFRQSGLHGNFSRIGALTENTDNYGTVLRPELSNIHILSAGFTMPVLTASNFGAIYRYYRLDEPAAALVQSSVNNALNGTDRELGQGLDLLFNMNLLSEKQAKAGRIQDVTFRSSLGFFKSGDAYGAADGETAIRGLAELKLGF